MAQVNEAAALLKAGKADEALVLLQKLLATLPAQVQTQPLRLMAAEAARLAQKPEQAARLYWHLAEDTQGLDSEYFRARAKELAPDVVKTETQAVPQAGTGQAGGNK